MAAKSTILVTGGAGYIGSHTVVDLISSGYAVTIADNLTNSNKRAISSIKALVPHPERISFVEADLRDKAVVEALFAGARFDAVIHFAALKAVGESSQKPIEYYENNIGTLLNVLAAMKKHGVHALVFSSSATVYGSGAPPFDESSPVGLNILSPYGQTKYMAEVILQDAGAADASLRIAILRYFNPVGAHPSGTIGEDPRGIPNNLVPVIQRVATGKLAKLTVFGTDYETPDGTAQRDFIHVVDLAAGHVKALEWLAALPPARAGAAAARANVGVFNLGTGTKSTVLEVVAAFERASAAKIAVELGPRRVGDAGAVWASTGKAAAELGWTARLDLQRMVEDSWRWASTHPEGYDTPEPAQA